MRTRKIADGVFEDGTTPVLFGGRQRATGRIVFPCPGGGDADQYERIALSPRGSLWSWTIQRFRPKSPPYAGPAAFEPFALGYVALPEGVIVQARLTGIGFDALRVGMALRLTVIPFADDEDGTMVTLYAFGPA